MTKLTPKKFITLYVKAKLKGFHTVLDICRYMNVRSKTTFYKFWNDPDIKNKIELKLNQSPKEFSLVQSDPSLARDIDGVHSHYRHAPSTHGVYGIFRADPRARLQKKWYYRNPAVWEYDEEGERIVTERLMRNYHI